VKNQKNIPPKLATRLLRAFLRTDLAEEVEGDLEEKFYSDLKSKSVIRSKFNYWFEMLNYLRPFAIKKSNSPHQNFTIMFPNYFKIALRNLLKQRLYSTINIGGLAIGLACFILILLYVQHEFSYDQFHQNNDRIYRVYQQQAGNAFMGSDYFGVTPTQLATVMENEFPEVESATALYEQTSLISFEDHNFWEKGLWADHHFFKVFTFPLIKGNVKTALEDPKGIVITKSLATKLFGEREPMGQMVKWRNSELFIVTGVLSDPPDNSSFQFSYITNIRSNSWFNEQLDKPTWSNNAMHTFFILAEGASPKALEEKFPPILTKYRDPVGYSNYPFKDKYFVQPLDQLHLGFPMNADIGVKGNLKFIYIFLTVGMIVLLLACVNYMNLAIARSMKRAREVGMRKVIGAGRGQLIFQFLGESVFIALLSLFLAVGIVYLIIPSFNNLVERHIEFNLFENSSVLPSLLILVVVVGVFSGSYPAIFMASLKPIKVLKGKIDGKMMGFGLQKILTVVQYVASMVMVIGSIAIYRQIEFIRNMELGYEKDNIITIPVRDDVLIEKYDVLHNEWLQQPGIQSACLISHLPTNITSSHLINDEDGSGPEDDVSIYECRTTEDFLNVFGIELQAGKNFSKLSGEKNEILINETAAKAMGWSLDEAIGKQILDNGKMNIIVGVIKDFHMHSMHMPIEPLMIRYATNWINHISIKVNPENLQETLVYLERSIGKISPYPFQYQMLEDNFNELYSSEEKLGEVFGLLTVLSILIASLGLFGLAAFTSEQRTKEIGIRKVLGASVRSVTLMLSKDFLSLVAIAFIIAVPIGLYLIQSWLQDFAYRVAIGWSIFGLAGLSAFVVANMAIGYQSLKAANTNPVNSLRSE
jgi:putative ABC transport system permease protein